MIDNLQPSEVEIRTRKVKPPKVLYIKLGAAGLYEKECIEESQTLRLSYKEVPHDLCIERNWALVHKFFIEKEKTSLGTATSHTNQIKQFYEEPEDTLWITFYGNRMWWCYSSPDITQHADGTKTRSVIGRWSDRNIKGDILHQGDLSGKLTQTQAFRGTICSVGESTYALAKINCEISKELQELEKSKKLLKQNLVKAVEHLNWKDFELLVDLIFRQAGWQRIGQLGKTTKSIDLELVASVTAERAVAQIKHKADVSDFKKYLVDFSAMEDMEKFFFIVCKPSQDLKSYKNDSGVKLYFGEEVADLVLNAGLVDWIITRTI